MACGCNINPASEIGSCGLPANKEDVVRLFNMVLNNCCLGEISTIGLDPLTNAVDSFDEAFPDGVESCLCECIYIRHTVTGQIYINCTQDYTDNDDWCIVCPPSCLGFLETEGLTPDDPLERIEAINEAFPIGLDNACEIHYIEREDGILCYSTDDGLTWHCPLDNRYIATMRLGGTPDVLDPTGSNVSGVGQLVRFYYNVSGEISDDGNLINMNDTSFSVNRSGRYIMDFCFQYRTAVRNNTNTSGFTMRFRRVSDGNIMAQSHAGGDADSGETELMNICVSFDLDLEVGEDYQMRFKHDVVVANIINYGSIGNRNYKFEFLG